jgi:glycosyltransferase involved in cell wall biosynthesis
MKVDLVSYVDPRLASGGGELALCEQLREAEARGHEVRHSHRFPRLTLDHHQRPDITILADVWNIPGHWSRIDRRFFAAISKRSATRRYVERVRKAVAQGKFVHYDNAYVDVCARGYLPCNGKLENGRCALDGDGRCARLRDRTRPLYERSEANTYVSPLHAHTIEAVIGDLALPALVVRPLLDVRMYADLGRDRDIPLLYVGPLTEGKGLEAMRRHPRSDEIWAVSKPPGRRVHWPGRRLDPVPFTDMKDLYNRAKSLIFLPRWPEPQGRVVAEAALCGCVLELNEMVGVATFDKSPGDPELSVGAAGEWWDSIESIL